MTSYILPIVGSFYRETGTKAIIDSLGVNTVLFLRPEPSNPVDPFAIMVWIKIEEIQPPAWKNLEVLLPKFGRNVDEVRDRTEWQLGYVPKDLAKPWEIEKDTPGEFQVSLSGAPMIKVELDEALKRKSKEQIADSELLRSQLKASVNDL